MKKISYNRAMGLIDVLIGIVLILIAFLGIVGAYQLSIQVSNQSKARTSATALANKRIEQVKNLAYWQIGTVGGYPVGEIPQEEVDNSGTLSFTVKTKIIYAINCKDGVGAQAGVECPSNAYGECPIGGCPVDDCPNDYKMVYVDVSWGGRFPGSVKDQTIISPKTKQQECQEKGGFLSVEVFNSLGENVSSPLIEILKISTGQEWNASPESGSYTFVLPEESDDYKITVSKDGYSSENTYALGETYQATGQIINTPDNPHADIFEGQITEMSFKIDKLSPLIFYTNQIYSNDVYYVRKTGDDGNSGLSPDMPLLSISEAISKANAGDVIYVGAGTYQESLEISKSGSDSDLISLIADTNGNYTKDQGEVVIQGTGNHTLEIDSNNYIKIFGFRIKEASSSAIFINGANNIFFSNNIVESADGDAFEIQSSTNVEIKGGQVISNNSGIYFNNCSNCLVKNNSISQNQGYGIKAENSQGLEISFNSISSNSGNGIELYSSSNASILNNSLVSNSGAGIKFFSFSDSECRNNILASNDLEGVFLDNSSNILVKNNLIYSNKKSGIKSTNNSTILGLSNNTITKNSEDGILAESSQQITIEDNIISNNSGIGVSAISCTSTESDYNNVFNNSSQYSGILAGENSTNTDPLFADLAGNNFHLSENSSCFDIGSDTSLNSGLSAYSTKQDNSLDSGVLDLGYHYYLGLYPENEETPNPFGIAISNVNFKMMGTKKTIGKDSSENYIYKVSTSSTTDGNGYLSMPLAENEEYVFSDFTRFGSDLDLLVSYPSPNPIKASPGITTTISFGFKSQNSLLITIKDNITSDPMFGVNVRIHNANIDQSLITNNSGQVFFMPLPTDTYTIEATFPDYATSSESFSVSGDQTKIMTLSEL